MRLFYFGESFHRISTIIKIYFTQISHLRSVSCSWLFTFSLILETSVVQKKKRKKKTNTSIKEDYRFYISVANDVCNAGIKLVNKVFDASHIYD